MFTRPTHLTEVGEVPLLVGFPDVRPCLSGSFIRNAVEIKLPVVFAVNGFVA